MPDVLAGIGSTFAQTALDGPLLAASAATAIAGAVSFASPCVLPLVPGYVGYVTGLSGDALSDRRTGRVVLGISLFVLGFAVVFVAEWEGRVARHPGQPARGLGRPGAHRPPVLRGARQDAAHERDHEQDVDGGEPERGIDVEDLEAVEDLPPAAVLLDEARHPARVLDALREQGSGDRGEREDEEEDERHPHGGELAPGPAQHPDRADVRRRGLGAGLLRSGPGSLPVGRLVRARHGRVRLLSLHGGLRSPSRTRR